MYSRYAAGHNQVPVIMLQGQWLRNNGFDIGDQILMTVNNKQLTIDFERDSAIKTKAQQMRTVGLVILLRYERHARTS